METMKNPRPPASKMMSHIDRFSSAQGIARARALTWRNGWEVVFPASSFDTKIPAIK
jgi:hypothetical protein